MSFFVKKTSFCISTGVILLFYRCNFEVLKCYFGCLKMSFCGSEDIILLFLRHPFVRLKTTFCWLKEVIFWSLSSNFAVLNTSFYGSIEVVFWLMSFCGSKNIIIQVNQRVIRLSETSETWHDTQDQREFEREGTPPYIRIEFGKFWIISGDFGKYMYIAKSMRFESLMFELLPIYFI